MKVCLLLTLFMFLLGSCSSSPSHLSKDSLKDPTGMIAHRKWLMQEIDMVKRELQKVTDQIRTTRILIQESTDVVDANLDGDIENYFSDLSRFEYEKIDLIKELEILETKL